MEPLESTELKDKKTSVERVTLGKGESEKVMGWIKQLEQSSSGFLTLNKSDIVNFLIREHRAELTPKELHQIRTDNYDPIRHLNWLAPKIKEALASKNLELVAALQAELRSVELAVIETASKGEPVVRAEKKRRSQSPKNKPATEEKSKNERVRFEDLQSENVVTADDED